VVVGVAALLALAGCSGGAAGTSPSGAASSAAPASVAASAAAQAAAGYGCLTPKDAGALVQLPVGDSVVDDTVVQGRGTVGVVFAHMAGEDLCEWYPYAQQFAQQGYLALTYTAGGGMDQDVAAVVGELKRRGATSVLLVGGSMGGTAVLTAASERLALPVTAVVSLSGPGDYAGADAAAAVKRLTMPVLFMADKDDAPFADDATTMNAACGSPVHQLKLYPGSAHASALLSDATALADFHAFVKKYAPPAA
jgi:pimeloyl-ACP methyl ester carboxylesterase